ncbi:MAG: hypothetical protein ACXWDO_08430 [Bacteroidia bacterium]
MAQSSEKFIRYTLGVLLLFLALNAFGGGYYGMAGAKDIPLEWLDDSPFRNYFIPSLVLFVLVGGSALVSGIMVLRRHQQARSAAFVCGALVLLWLIAQVAIIGYVSWMQPTTALLGFVILSLAWKLPTYQQNKL